MFDFKKMTENGHKIPKYVHTSVEYLFEQRLKISNHLDIYLRRYYNSSVNCATVSNFIIFNRFTSFYQ